MQTKKWSENEERRSLNGSSDKKVSIKTGLQHKFLVPISVLIAVFSLAFFVFYSQSIKKVLSDLYHMQCVDKYEEMIITITTLSPSLNENELTPLIKELVKSEKLAYVKIFNIDGELVHAEAADNQSLPDPVQPDQVRTATLQISGRQHTKMGEIKDISAPIYLASENEQGQRNIIGYIQAGIRFTPIANLIFYHKLWLVVGIGVFILFGIILSLYLYRIIISPIHQMARAMKEVSESEVEFDEDGHPLGRRFRRGNELNLHIRSNDEIEQLADEFEIMVKRLESSYRQMEAIVKEKTAIAKEKSKLADKLRKVNQQNEEVIKERTREIVEKNLRLYEISEELQFQKEELIGTNEDLEKVSRMKSEFLASMSHELRTPLNAIIGFAEVLKDKMFGSINERQEKYLHNIVTSGKHLLNLINGILDISKVEAGKMRLNIEPFAVNKVIEEVQNIIKTLAYKKNIQINLALSRDLMVEGDVARFKQILYNLLSNAIKFTEEKGNILIYTTEVAEGMHFSAGAGGKAFTTEEDSFWLIIKDSGIGIPEEDQLRIFNEFEQLDQTSGRQFEGTGLGLPLTRQLVNLHGGYIWIESKVNEGTSVNVVMPIKSKPVEIDPDEETP